MSFAARGVADSKSGGKFWAVEVDGSSLTTTWGKVGDSGSSKTKEFADEAAAVKEAEKLVKSKEKSGYIMEEATAKKKPKAAAKKEPAKKAPAATKKAPAKKKKAEEEDDEAPAPKKAKKAAAASPTKKKVGLSGFAAPDEDDEGAASVDTGVAGADAAVASNATLLEPFSARLALVEPAKNSDKYYIAQVLQVQGKGKGKGKKAAPLQYYCFTRWGRTGHGGQCSLDGPFDESSEAEEIFSKTFKSKTGQSFEDADPAVTKKGKYSYLKSDHAAVASKEEGHWEYHLTNDPDGKRDGWYPYSADGSHNVEMLYETYAIEGNSDFSTRFVQSGTFTYKVDLSAMMQTNTHSGTSRSIRRVAS